ncbi:LysR family substrate-binding domain-containing protein [Nocardioides jiangxiensis]|uniref:LysR family substrate-binding domain-containing protein n=1 Tax=Nocardioides jiangxiensis TaxID=3064524 RepID=A0ABT9B4H3_9ACTN|nr:LysR family substrate-binding domain-containing protein [Nocardioides sp. WY-20]MDO7869632.1 LysR family substrate-binding domain-containing protein [Nocardioides sp. WY-20]
MQEPIGPLAVAFVAGVSPDKWSKRWRERYPDAPLELRMVATGQQRAVLTDGTASISFVRLPVDRDGLHVIPLYEEVSVAVLSVEDDLSLEEQLTIGDLAGHQLVTDPADLPGWAEVATVERLPYPSMSAKDAVEVVSSGAGGVAVLPMSVARLHHRKDVVARELTDGPLHPVGIAWRREDEDPRIDTFIGIVRGRTADSSRGTPTPPTPKKKAAARPKQPAKKASAQKNASSGQAGRGGAGARRSTKGGAKGTAKRGRRR